MGWAATVDRPITEPGPAKALLAAPRCDGPGCGEIDPAKAQAAAMVLEADLNEDYVEQLKPTRSELRLIYRVVVGDTGHAAGPVVLQDAAGQEVARFFDRRRQVILAQRGALVLIAEEYTGADPVIVDLETGRVVWQSTGKGAVWWPSDGRRRP